MSWSNEALYRVNEPLNQYNESLHRVNVTLHRFNEALHRVNEPLNQYNGSLHRVNETLDQYNESLDLYNNEALQRFRASALPALPTHLLNGSPRERSRFAELDCPRVGDRATIGTGARVLGGAVRRRLSGLVQRIKAGGDIALPGSKSLNGWHSTNQLPRRPDFTWEPPRP